LASILGIPAEILLNLATALFFSSSFPQMIRSFRRRKQGLGDFSIYSWLTCLAGTIVMALAGLGVGAWATVIIETLQGIYVAITLYWMLKYRRKIPNSV